MGLGSDEAILLEFVKMAFSLRIEYADPPFFIPFLNEASSQLMGDLIDAEGEGDVKLDIGVPGVVGDL